jgi:hypothetical protein
MTQETKSRLPKSATSRPAGNTRPGARSGGTTKKAQLIQMLSRKAGADIVTISDKLGWLPHTTRAALSRRLCHINTGRPDKSTPPVFKQP